MEPTKKKISYIQRQRSHNETVRGVHLQYNQIPYKLGRWPTNWKIIISQRFSHRTEHSEPHIRLPSLRVWRQEEEPQEHSALKANRSWLQELHRTRENRNATLGGHTESHVHWVPGKKQWLHRSLGQTYLLVLEGLLRRQGWLWLTMGTRTLVAEVLGSTHWCDLSWRPPFCHQDPAPLKSL